MNDLLQLVIPLALLVAVFGVVMIALRKRRDALRAQKIAENAHQLDALRQQTDMLEDVARSVDRQNG